MTDTIILKILEMGVFPLVLLIIGWAIGRYVKPWIHAKPSRYEKAKEIALVADRITDELVLAMPTARWDDLLDRLIDKIIHELDISRDVARREGIHQLRTRGRLA